MAATVDLMPVYTGTLPNKDSQTATVFDAAADEWIIYEYSTYVPAFNNIAGQLNVLSAQVETYNTQSASYASTASGQASAAAASAASAQTTADGLVSDVTSLATSVGNAQAQVNAQLGLGIGTSYVDANGHLQMIYDDGVITSISLDADGHLILEY